MQVDQYNDEAQVPGEMRRQVKQYQFRFPIFLQEHFSVFFYFFWIFEQMASRTVGDFLQEPASAQLHLRLWEAAMIIVVMGK